MSKRYRTIEHLSSRVVSPRQWGHETGRPGEGATFSQLRWLREGVASAAAPLAKARGSIQAALADLRAFDAKNEDRFTGGSRLPVTLGPNLDATSSALVDAYQNSGLQQPTGSYARAQDAGELVNKIQRMMPSARSENGWNDVDVKLLVEAVEEADRAVDDAVIMNRSETSELRTAAELVRRDPSKRTSDFHKGPFNEPGDWKR